MLNAVIFLIFKRFYLLERGERKEKERERNISVWLPLVRPLRGAWPTTQAYALDWELNLQPCGSQAGTQSTKSHQPRQCCDFCNYNVIV